MKKNATKKTTLLEVLPSQRRGLLFILSSPSGAGKTSVTRGLLAQDKQIALSISSTTRPRRKEEVEGKDYHFVSEESFAKQVECGEFIEWAQVFDHAYGTPKSPIYERLAVGKDMLFDIDWQGAQRLKEVAGGDVISIFLLPPSWKALEKRLAKRAQDPPEVVEKRMNKAESEMAHWPEYDYVLINLDLQKTINSVQTILNAERLRRNHQKDLTQFVDGLKPEKA